MPVLDRFRRKVPDWEHADPQVRAEAVRRLGRREQELLVTIARNDEAARVRRVAVHKLEAAEVLTEVARSDEDAEVRDEACERLLRVACQDEDEATAGRALEVLSDPRQLLTAAREAAHESVRRAALGRLEEARIRASVAKTSPHAETRLAALASLDDPDAVLDVALRSEHRDSALAALERIEDEAALREVAEHGRQKSAARRARARLKPPPAPEPPAGVAVETASVEPAPSAPAVAAPAEPEPLPESPAVLERRGLCEALEALAIDAPEEEIERLEASFSALEPVENDAVVALEARFNAAATAWRERRGAAAKLEAARPAQLEACLRLEQLLAAETEPSPEDWESATAAWSALVAEGPVDPELERRAAVVRAARKHFEAEQAEARKRELLGVAEQLEKLGTAASLDLREVEAALRAAREALSHPGTLPTRRDRETLLERIRAARAAIFPKAQELREEDEWTRWANVGVLEELCTRVEALAASDDLAGLARELRDIDARWKKGHPVPREEGAALWARFRATREPLRKRIGEYLVARRAERAKGVARRKELTERAEALRESTSWVETARELQALQAEWKALPAVGRRQSEKLWEKFHAACQVFFDRRKADLQSRRQDQARNLERKQELVKRAEELRDSTAWDATSAEIRKLQAEWKAVGPVRKGRSDKIWEQFHGACDAFFERYRHRDEIADDAAVAERGAVCAALEALRPAEGEAPPEDLAARVSEQLERWRSAAPVRGSRRAALEERFRAARDGLVGAHVEAFAGTDLDPRATLARREKLCQRVEAHLGDAAPVMDLAARLKEALTTNALGGAVVAEARAREAFADLDDARAAWVRLGPVIGDEASTLEQRFDAACKRFEQAHPRRPAPPAAPRSGAGRGRPFKPSRGRRPPR